MQITVNPSRAIGKRDPMIYGQFIEHFHRQIYGGVYDPQSPLADEDGFRTDVLEAMRKIRVPVLRWPGGCFVSSYHWKDGVGPVRTPMYDKAWRVEEPNTFGTDEFIKLCRKVGCEPYLCTNAGSGTAEEMSDWVEYCNLESEGCYAKMRIANGNTEPFRVKYWSIGNENYGSWEIGAKTAEEWGRFALESAKMMQHVDSDLELSAAALTDLDWNVNLLRHCGERLSWISIHEYWDAIHQTNDYATYEQTMAYTSAIDRSIRKVRGLLEAMGLENSIRIAFDEWNLRGWYHPNSHTLRKGLTKADYLAPRDLNDDNTKYTMADAVFSACFLNACNRHCDIVGMANFAPVVNTRGCIYTHPEGIVLRTTYHVFDLYVNYLGDTVLDLWEEGMPQLAATSKSGETVHVDALDLVATSKPDGSLAIAAVNKDPAATAELSIEFGGSFAGSQYRVHTLAGSGTESYNDVGHDGAVIESSDWMPFGAAGSITLSAHSVNVIEIQGCL